MSSFSSSYYLALYAAYFSVLLCWFAVYRFKPQLWPAAGSIHFEKPWMEVLYVLGAVVVTMLVGQIYVAHWLLPETKGQLFPVMAILNQIIIFSPFPLLVWARRQSFASAWLSPNGIFIRFGLGIILSFIAMTVFVAVRNNGSYFPDVASHVYHMKNVSYAVQIFLEEFAIAVFFVRLRSAITPKWFLVGVTAAAFLFSAAHYPAKLNEGLSFWVATMDVIVDTVLVSAVIYALQRSNDIVWFWPIHFVMDMMQFYTGDPAI